MERDLSRWMALWGAPACRRWGGRFPRFSGIPDSWGLQPPGGSSAQEVRRVGDHASRRAEGASGYDAPSRHGRRPRPREYGVCQSRCDLPGRSSIRCSATWASRSVSGSTSIWLTTDAVDQRLHAPTPGAAGRSGSSSSSSRRCGRGTRCPCRGAPSASRLTRLSSVPIAQVEPGGGGLDGLDDELRRADQVGLEHDLVGALGVDQDLDAGDASRAARRRRRRRTGRAPSSGPSTGSSSPSRSSLGGEPAVGLRAGPRPRSRRGVRPILSTAVLRPRCWSGRNSTFASGLLLERPLERDLGVGRRADDAAVAAAERLDVGARSSCRSPARRRRRRRRRSARPRRPRPGPSRAMSAIEQPAARSGRITCWSGAVRMSADSAMKCTPQKTMNSASGPGRGVAGQLEGVAGDVGELDDLVALVVVAEHEHPLAQRRLGRAGPRHQVRVGGGRQVARALDAALGGEVACPGRGGAGAGRRWSWRHPSAAYERGLTAATPWWRYGAGGLMSRSAEVAALVPSVEPGRQPDVDRPLVGGGDVARPATVAPGGDGEALPQQPGRGTPVGRGQQDRRAALVDVGVAGARSRCR